MKTEEEKQTWVTPEIVDLDVMETKSKPNFSINEISGSVSTYANQS